MLSVSRLDWFRRFLVARSLFLSIELVMPFFAIHAATFHASSALNLGMFIIASSTGMVLGGIIWPRVSRFSIKLVMTASPLIALAAAFIGLVTHAFPDMRSPFSYFVTFMLLSFALRGIVAARTVYIVGAASDEERPYCVAASNVVAGVLGLPIAVVIGAVSHKGGSSSAFCAWRA